jgi:hypothetical protein
LDNKDHKQINASFNQDDLRFWSYFCSHVNKSSPQGVSSYMK